MVVVDGQGIPLGGTLASASPSEVKLIEATLDQVKVPRGGRGRPRKRMPRLIADKSYDSDPLRKRLKRQRGIDLICPHRRNRTKPRLQDGRKLRRYRRRFIIERTFCLAGRLQASGGALGAADYGVSRVFSSRVLDDRSETVMKPVLIIKKYYLGQF